MHTCSDCVKYCLICMQADYGPFQPNRPVEVPLWMAMALHKRKKCRILPPGWMDIDSLKGAV